MAPSEASHSARRRASAGVDPSEHAPELKLELKRELTAHFGHRSFRPGQEEIVAAVLSGRNSVVVMPTGAGKSLCYQLPALVLDGVTVVVSPLIALMQDQVDQLRARGIAATFINSTLSDVERAERQRQLRAGAFRLVYVAPERFRSEAFTDALLEAGVALFAVDEAHCISQWGHDFRPDYAELGQVRWRLRPPRTVALTATATPEVRADIARVLRLKDPRVFVAGFDRPNLFLEVASVGGDADKRRAIEAVAKDRGSGLVYCATRKQAEHVHQHLAASGLRSVLYHAGLPDAARRSAQEAFMSTDGTIAVATNAFGMGVDKPDVGFVVHAAMPRTVEAYYQEIGRAGRDGRPSRAVLLFNHADVFTQERLIRAAHPPDALFHDVWKQLRAEGRFEHGIQRLAAQVDSSELEVSAVLKLLERGGAIARGARGEGRWGLELTPVASSASIRGAAALALLAALSTEALPGHPIFLELSQVGQRCGLDEAGARRILGLLERAGAVRLVRPFAGRSIRVLASRPWDGLELGVELGRLREQERRQLQLLRRMTDYAYTKRCRRAFLLRYFGEHVGDDGRCGACDLCRDPLPIQRSSSADGASSPARLRWLPESWGSPPSDPRHETSTAS
jgi:ATP-dependent DNA helicase RecQ